MDSGFVLPVLLYRVNAVFIRLPDTGEFLSGTFQSLLVVLHLLTFRSVFRNQYGAKILCLHIAFDLINDHLVNIFQLDIVRYIALPVCVVVALDPVATAKHTQCPAAVAASQQPFPQKRDTDFRMLVLLVLAFVFRDLLLYRGELFFGHNCGVSVVFDNGIPFDFFGVFHVFCPPGSPVLVSCIGDIPQHIFHCTVLPRLSVCGAYAVVVQLCSDSPHSCAA